ncbi:MAG: hypothetical protein SGILL_010454, partial [Bacillariaceae sp.]
CLSDDEDECFDEIQDLETTLEGDAGSLASLTSCDITEAYFCTYITCCPECQDELRAIYACEVDESSLVAECPGLSCLDTGPGSPGEIPTEAPIGGGTDPQGTAATPAPNGGSGTETELPGDSSAKSLGGAKWQAMNMIGMIIAAVIL